MDVTSDRKWTAESIQVVKLCVEPIRKGIYLLSGFLDLSIVILFAFRPLQFSLAVRLQVKLLSNYLEYSSRVRTEWTFLELQRSLFFKSSGLNCESRKSSSNSIKVVLNNQTSLHRQLQSCRCYFVTVSFSCFFVTSADLLVSGPQARGLEQVSSVKPECTSKHFTLTVGLTMLTWSQFSHQNRIVLCHIINTLVNLLQLYEKKCVQLICDVYSSPCMIKSISIFCSED